MANKDGAKRKLDEFELRTDAGKWSHLSRSQIASDLRIRIENPDKIDQNRTSLCGASSLFHELATDDPEKYAQTAIDLFEKGQASISNLTLKPSADLMNYKLDDKDIAQGDWILAASLRDSGNWFMDYQGTGNDAAAITIPSTMAKWFKAAGYKDVRNETNLLLCKDWDNAQEASELKKHGYHVCLFINADLLENPTQASVIPDHWIVLLSTIDKVNVDCCKLTCFSWGERRPVPKVGNLRIMHFEWNYYGYVACKF